MVAGDYALMVVNVFTRQLMAARNDNTHCPSNASTAE
jgi:hypothetical protein